MFMELSTNAEAAAEFVNKVVPASLQAEVAAAQASEDAKAPSTVTTTNFELPAVSDIPPASSDPAWVT